VHAGTTRVHGAIYASRQAVSPDELTDHLALFADLLRRHAGAESAETALLLPESPA